MFAEVAVVFSLFMFTGGKQLPVALYYESLCPDSVGFITNQLSPSFKTLANYISLDLVPFGFATENNSTGHWEFSCQHGPEECFRNKVHSCVIVSNPVTTTLDFINCTMTLPQTNSSIVTCARAFGVSVESLANCLSSGEGDNLLAENGVRTGEVTPRITFIPTVIFNGVYDQRLQDEAQKHFVKVVCELLKGKPDVCKNLAVLYNYVP